jgi:hypothetical protein
MGDVREKTVGANAPTNEDLAKLRLSIVELDPSGLLAPITESPWLMLLREHLRPELEQHGVDVLKLGELLGHDVSISQHAADLIRTRFPHVGGIIIPSTLGSEFHSISIFEQTSESGHLRINTATLATGAVSFSMDVVRTALERLNLATPKEMTAFEPDTEPNRDPDISIDFGPP